jgi:hypothetical protein
MDLLQRVKVAIDEVELGQQTAKRREKLSHDKTSAKTSRSCFFARMIRSLDRNRRESSVNKTALWRP